jgi:hypothetical protein
MCSWVHMTMCCKTMENSFFLLKFCWMCMICLLDHYVYRSKSYFSVFKKMKICKKKTSMVFHTNFSLHCRKWSSFFSLLWNMILLLKCWIRHAHMTNLVVQTMSHLALVSSIKDMNYNQSIVISHTHLNVSWSSWS